MHGWMKPGAYFAILYKSLFKSISFREEVEDWGRSERLRAILWTGAYNLFTCLALVVGLCSILSLLVQEDINWGRAFIGFAVAVAINVAFGVDSRVARRVTMVVASGVALGVASGVAGGVTCGVTCGVAVSVAVGVTYGVAVGVTYGVVASGVTALGIAALVAIGVAIGVAGGVAFGVAGGVASGVAIGVAYTTSFILVFSRIFYYPFYWLTRATSNRNPLHWDENICLPVPWLSQLLLYYKREEGVAAAAGLASFLVENRPLHRKTAQRGLVALATDVMERFSSIQQIAQLPQELDFMPPPGKMTEDYAEALRELSTIAEDVHLAWQEDNLANRLRLYKRVRDSISDFQRVSNASRQHSYVQFRKVGRNWLQIVEREIARIEDIHGKPLPNPFVTGPPVQPEDGEVFVGRSDIIQAIQTEALREGATGAILFTGGRRTGKSSTLLQLNRFLPSTLRAVYFDCQSPKVKESLMQFCRNFAEEIGRQVPKLRNKPVPNNLSALTDWLEAAEETLRAEGRHILICIDEYERLGPLIQDGTLRGLADALRSWVQRFRRLTFLFAGSHELRELGDIDWTDYLINVRTVYISYLDEASALKLVTKPVPEFDMQYQPETLPRNLTERLGRQPYLLQCAMSELVEYLNGDSNRKIATPPDLDQAVTRIFSAAGQYLEHLWEQEFDDEARKLLLRLAKGKAVDEKTPIAKRLLRKEIIRRTDGSLVFCVPALQEWIQEHY